MLTACVFFPQTICQSFISIEVCSWILAWAPAVRLNAGHFLKNVWNFYGHSIVI